MATGETTVNPAALSGVRFLVTRRVEELDVAGDRQEAIRTQAASRRSQLGEQLDDATITWGHVVNNLGRFTVGDVEGAFQTLSSLRTEQAMLEERFRDVDARLADIRAEQEVLRSVYRSLDDLNACNGTSPASSSSRLGDASRQVFQMIEEERMRIARDMHDGPAQSMANLVLQAEIMERSMAGDPHLVSRELGEFRDGVRRVIDDTRRLIFDLRPMTLDDLGLVPSLRTFLKDYSDKSGITTHLRVSGEEARLPGTLEPTLLRIIQEALNNVRKHADATSAEVIIAFQPTTVAAVVRDDGRGFDVAATEAQLDATRTLGMISMRERAELEKGSLQIRSLVGKGTEIRASFEWR